MAIVKKRSRSFLLILVCLSILALQLIWLHHAYRLKYQQLMADIKEAFEQAYQKEQTYRVPVVDIINPGDVTIQSCGSEDVLIIRKCPEPDTIVYSNISGHSIENFINRVFGDLREHITPLNIYCLADLFGGMLHDKDIPVYFAVERLNIETNDVLETSLLPDKRYPEVNAKAITIELSDTEVIRAVFEFTPTIVLGRMTGIIVTTVCLTVIALFCATLLYRCKNKQSANLVRSTEPLQIQNTTFSIGKYSFDPNKNELQSFGETIQLNKKENSILYRLCMQRGNVVERNTLLEENWGSNGVIYSRSLDTYITTLRKYLKQDPAVQIVTIKSVGYKLVVNGE
ncbi:MAG: winged helix-turn-helix domain-containing protein [Prevotellaceae bacterium]|jgi:DNA-binding winged helix-turn-helix (wHTH) protein|nr:winged helix-turn-helix domain-containing protein [Prevotellaceae bacterium]